MRGRKGVRSIQPKKLVSSSVIVRSWSVRTPSVDLFSASSRFLSANSAITPATTPQPKHTNMTTTDNPMPEGMVFPDFPVTVSEQDQTEKLRCCSVDPTVHGGLVDITALAGESIMATKHAGVSINGSVHVGQYFDLRAPIELGEPLVLHGRVTKVVAEPRGHVVTCTFEAERADGTVPLLMERTSLRIAQEATKGPLGKGAAREPERELMRLEATKQLLPANVAEYSIEAENLIHSDPAVAREFGFRAPIAGGLMAVRMMMEVLAQRGPIDQLQMSVRFRRPMFWDEVLEIRSQGSAAMPEAFAVFQANGKVVNDAVVHALNGQRA